MEISRIHFCIILIFQKFCCFSLHWCDRLIRKFSPPLIVILITAYSLSLTFVNYELVYWFESNRYATCAIKYGNYYNMPKIALILVSFWYETMMQHWLLFFFIIKYTFALSRVDRVWGTSTSNSNDVGLNPSHAAMDFCIKKMYVRS